MLCKSVYTYGIWYFRIGNNSLGCEGYHMLQKTKNDVLKAFRERHHYNKSRKKNEQDE